MNFIKQKFTNVLSLNKQEKNESEKQKIEKDMCQKNDPDIPQDILKELFEISAKKIRESNLVISDNTKLQLYGLYKRATSGLCDESTKPGLYNMISRQKWQSWKNYNNISQTTAMRKYIISVSEVHPNLKKCIMQQFIDDNDDVHEHSNERVIEKQREQPIGDKGLKIIKQVDYSNNYSHKYFKSIEKGEQIINITHDELMIKNNNPKVYALHFAIDKQRVDLVKQFLDILSCEEIASMKDQEGTNIIEYAQLIQNEEIIKLVNKKMSKF